MTKAVLEFSLALHRKCVTGLCEGAGAARATSSLQKCPPCPSNPKCADATLPAGLPSAAQPMHAQ